MNNQTFVLSPPIGGINTTAPIDQIPDGSQGSVAYAQVLTNLYPDIGKLLLRNGIAEHNQLTANVSEIKSIYSFTLPDGQERLVCAAEEQIFDVTSGDIDITGTTTPTLSEWQGVAYNHRLFLVNGEDTPQVWTGSGSCTDATFTGVELSNLVNVTTYRERIYFVEKDSAKLWYGGLQAVSGELTEVDFSFLFKRGGFIVACGSWTNQTSDTSQDLFWIISSEGEILFYQGSFPGDTNWSIVGRYYIGKPLSYRCEIDVENDSLLITNAGIIPISSLFGGGIISAQDSFSREINCFIRIAAESIGFSYLWSGVYWSAGRRVYVQVPITNSSTELYVCNLEIGSWCKYEILNDPSISTVATNQPLQIAIFNNFPYAGSFSGVVHKYETGFSDNDRPISFRAMYAWSYFGDRRSYKVMSDVRTLVRANPNVEFGVTVDTDFTNTGAIQDIVTSEGVESSYDTSPYDTTPYSDEESLFNARSALSGQGHSVALRIEGSLKNSPFEINTIEIGYKPGARI